MSKRIFLVLLLFNLLLFVRPIAEGSYISPADTLQRLPSFNLGEFHSPQNSLLFDVVTQFHPWYKYTNETIGRGDLPFWNSLNASGVPFMANNISALFFPLSSYYFFVDFKYALILFYITKMLLIGVFTYLYLREIGLKEYPSLIGAVAFNFSGFNIVWMLWPQTNVIVMFPLLMLLVENLVNKTLNGNKAIVLISISFALALTAGHPETLVHVLLIVVIYFLFRISSKEYDVSYRILKIKLFTKAILVSILLSGVILVPFTEYLFNSYALFERSRQARRLLEPISFVYNLFPNLSGNPSTGFYRPIFGANYNELIGGYTGWLILALSVLGTLYVIGKERKYIFFVLLGLGVMPFIYRLPFFSQMALVASQYSGNTRLLFVLSFSQSVLASITLDGISKIKDLRSKLLIMAILVSLSAVLVISLLNNVPLKVFGSISTQKFTDFINYEERQIFFAASTFIVGAIFLIKIRDKANAIFYLFLAIVVFLQTGFLNIDYNPAIDKKYFYPENSSIEFLQLLPAGKFMQLGGNLVIPDDVNLWYGLESADNYDAIDIKEYRYLYNFLFDNRSSWGSVKNAKSDFIDLFGVKYLLSYTDLNAKIIYDQPESEKYGDEIVDGVLTEADFTAEDDDLYSVILLPANFNRLNNCQIKFTLYQNGAELYSNISECEDIYDRIYTQFYFPTVQDSKGQKFTFELEIINGSPGNTVSFWTNKQGVPVFQTLYSKGSRSGIELVHQGKFNIYENKNSLPEYYLANKVLYIEHQKIPEILKNNYNSRDRQAYIGVEHEKDEIIKEAESNSDSVEIVESSPLSKRINIYDSPGTYLISTNSFYPGWKAYVDGTKRKLVKANYAFQGVFIPPGDHQVEIVYRPFSYYLGVGFSLVGAILLAKLLVKKKNDK